MGRITREQLTFTNNELTGQTAEEVYQEWLENKDKLPQPDFEELQLDYNIDLDYRLSLVEMGLV